MTVVKPGDILDPDDAGQISLALDFENILRAVPFSRPPAQLEGLNLSQAQINGLIRGYVLGHNTSIGISSIQDLTNFGEDYITQPTSLTSMEIVSDSVEDATGLTGAVKVEIQGIDENFAYKSQQVTLNGTTVVTLDDNSNAIQFLKINHVFVLEPSPNNVNHTAIGNITLRGLAGGTTFGLIEAGTNMELAARATVADGFRGYITSWNASAGKIPNQADELEFFLRGTVDPFNRTLLTNVFTIQDIMILNNNSNHVQINPPLEFPPRSEVKISAKLRGSAGTTIAAASFQFWIVPEP